MRVPLLLRASLAAAILAAAACTGPMLGPDPLPPPAPGQPPAALGPAGVWLTQHPAVAAAVVWETDHGAIAWADWDASGKRQLEDAFAAELAALQGTGNPLGYPLQDPPLNTAAYTSRALTVLSPHDAFRLYVAHVGHSLALEVLHAVPWSIAADGPDALAAMLDGRSMFTYEGRHGGYLVDMMKGGWLIPGPPALELGFLTREKLLAPTRRETIERLVDWARRLSHFTGRMENDNAERLWQYRGLPPVSRVLAGTGPQGQHYTAGCWGTTGLFIAVLRAANVPVRLVNVRGQARRGSAACSHALPYFVSEHLFLSHGDDPYSRLVTTTEDGEVPARRLILDGPTWQAWFGDDVDPHSRCANVGRTAMEVALEALPSYLLDAYCDDQRTGVDPRVGKVARAFNADLPGGAFPLARLQGSHLWERLAEKAHRTLACTKKHPPPSPASPEPEPEPEP